MNITEKEQAIQSFGTRLQRVFNRNKDSSVCNCGRGNGHSVTCPKRVWETAGELVRMEMEDAPELEA